MARAFTLAGYVDPLFLSVLLASILILFASSRYQLQHLKKKFMKRAMRNISHKGKITILASSPPDACLSPGRADMWQLKNKL